MKKLLLICILIANYCSAQVSDKVFFVDKNNEYSLLIKPLTKIKYDTLQGSIPATEFAFFTTTDTTFKYVLLVIKADTALNNIADGYVTDLYATDFKTSCKCTVVESKKVAYNNVKAYQFIYTRNTYKSYFNYIVTGKYIYTLSVLFKDTDFDKYKDEYTNMMNTLVFNQ